MTSVWQGALKHDTGPFSFIDLWSSAFFGYFCSVHPAERESDATCNLHSLLDLNLKKKFLFGFSGSEMLIVTLLSACLQLPSQKTHNKPYRKSNFSTCCNWYSFLASTVASFTPLCWLLGIDQQTHSQRTLYNFPLIVI